MIQWRNNVKILIFQILVILSLINIPTHVSIGKNIGDISTVDNKHNVFLNDLSSSDYYRNNNTNKKQCNNEDIFFTTPLDNDVFRAGDLIFINGTIKGKRFKNYSIEYGLGSNPTYWESTGINLIGDGKKPITNSTLATWDTQHITEAGFCSLRVKVIYRSIFSFNDIPSLLRLFCFGSNNAKKSEIALIDKTSYINNLYLDPSLKDGWPVRLNWDINEISGNYVWGGKVEPVASDVNNDGVAEVFVLLQASPYSRVYCFEPDGSSVDGWPIEIVDNCSISDPIPTLITPTIADIDNDGYKEIIISSCGGIQVFSSSGVLKHVINLKVASQPRTETVVFDLNHDGALEIVKLFEKYAGDGLYLTVFDCNGTKFPHWPQLYYNFSRPGGGIDAAEAVYEAAPAIGNFDDDSDLEIVVVSGRNVYDDLENPIDTHHIEGRISVFNLDGSILDGFPVDIDGWPYCSPAIGDINKDGYDEIIVGSRFSNTDYSGLQYGLFAVNHFGDFCEGWPQLIGKGYGVCHHPALADFNNDGFLEIIVGTVNQYDETGHSLYVFDYKGQVLPGWPQMTTWYSPVSPIIADITGDSVPDIIVVAGGGFVPYHLGEGGVYAWKINGSLVEGFPKIIEWPYASVSIVDLDSDGMSELIGSSGDDIIDYNTTSSKYRSSVYIWDLSSVFDVDFLEWPMYHHDRYYSGWYNFK